MLIGPNGYALGTYQHTTQAHWMILFTLVPQVHNLLWVKAGDIVVFAEGEASRTDSYEAERFGKHYYTTRLVMQLHIL